jgi:hypothetical protein
VGLTLLYGRGGAKLAQVAQLTAHLDTPLATSGGGRILRLC